jgi:hypothetical protein
MTCAPCQPIPCGEQIPDQPRWFRWVFYGHPLGRFPAKAVYRNPDEAAEALDRWARSVENADSERARCCVRLYCYRSRKEAEAADIDDRNNVPF